MPLEIFYKPLISHNKTYLFGFSGLEVMTNIVNKILFEYHSAKLLKYGDKSVRIYYPVVEEKVSSIRNIKPHSKIQATTRITPPGKKLKVIMV